MEKENTKEIKIGNIDKKLIIKDVLEWFISIIIAIIIAFLIKYYLGTFTTVQQVSMYPTLENNQKLWLDRTVRTFNGEYKRGDIVTFASPKVEKTYISNENPKAIYDEVQNEFVYSFLEFGKISLIKRVIGLPGDKIQIKDGKVYVNGNLKEENYINNQGTQSYKLTEFTVPKGYYFLMGDNRDRSSDSREFGCIPKEKIEGRAVLRVWPLDKIKVLKNEQN